MKIVQKRLLLQYPKAGKPGWYSRPTSAEDAEKFVALDGPSGGYPYPTEIQDAHDFKTAEKADQYRLSFKQFEIREVTVTFEF